MKIQISSVPSITNRIQKSESLRSPKKMKKSRIMVDKSKNRAIIGGYALKN